MFLFILFLLLALIAGVAFGVSFFLPNPDTTKTYPNYSRRWTRVSAAATLVVGLFVLLFASFTVVGTKNVAVLTTAGRPTGYLDNGFHWIAPWSTAHEINDAVQTDTYASDEGQLDKRQGGATDTCIHVRIARQATACVNVSVRWQIRPSGVDYLYRNFKSTQHIQDNVMLRDLQQAMNTSFSNYDPLGIDAQGNNTNPSLNIYAQRVQTQMRDEISKWIDVQSVIIPIMNYDASTQAKVNQLLQQIAQTRVAQQAEQTAKAQARANSALAQSVSNDPNVLVSKCLDIVREAVDGNKPLPAGFNCFGPANNIAVGTK